MEEFLKSLKKLVLASWESVKPRWKNIAYLLLVEMGIGFLIALIVGIFFVIFPDYSLIGIIALGRFSPSMIGYALHSPAILIMLLGFLILGLASLLLSSFVVIAFVIALKEDAKINFGKLLEKSKNKYWNYCGTLLLASILIALAALVFVIPGILLAIMYFAVPFIVVETGLKNMAALKSSWDLVKGNALKVFSHLFVFGLCMGLISMILGKLGFIGQLLSIGLSIGSLAFAYELYRALKPFSAQRELPIQQ
jgi:hypothetical protein